MPGTNKDHKRSKQRDPERAVVRKVPARGVWYQSLKLSGRNVRRNREDKSAGDQK